MKPTVAILSISVVPVSEILPFFTEHLPPEQVSFINLLDGMTREEILENYAPAENEETLVAQLGDRSLIQIGQDKIIRAMQKIISVLDNSDCQMILVMSTLPLPGLTAQNVILLEPTRIIPPLVASIVDGHQVGVIVSTSELIRFHNKKWHPLDKPPIYEIARSMGDFESELLSAGQRLIDQGASVLLLDCLVYLQKHRDFLQSKFDVPVLLSNMMVLKLAAELLV